ncbi:hypothetical protein FVB9288_03095 [Flavobacterium sp. CECT 9288]|uniref:hypothetical protein n=1 Tax=Flavobacterium sp. CECT 9288 TaxID=2845819 RepID=UPI001E3BB4E4|nr:hypothetical protein [Flavobacterium sp. CECT 9288]CAH0337340.1 hypothetical protein FVB9288_03095 [Flavobacterium sp. CECT 9288]
MKKYYLFTIITLLFFSTLSQSLFSQSQKEKNRAINDYFEKIYKDTTQVIFVAREKINSNETLKIFGLNDIMIIDADGNGKGDDTLYDKKDFEIMKTKYKNKCLQGKRIWCKDDFWKKDNFRFEKVVLESMNTDKGIELMVEKYNRGDIEVYGFSEPIYYQNNKYVVFTVHKLLIGAAKTIIVIMKKVKYKWIVTHKGSTNVLN